MPLTISGALAAPHAPVLRDRRLRPGTIHDRGARLRVALVNNMPDSAVLTAERQFRRLIEDAAGEFDVALTLVALQTVPREPAARAALAETYAGPGLLRRMAPDAILVTGAEPRAEHLADEPYWRELTGLIDWAHGAAVSALFSCLAAHAAAHHLDRIPRRRLREKLSGLFDSEALEAHELTEGLQHWLTPHSRWNAILEEDLLENGYRILSRSPQAGPDVFVRERGGFDVFWQGHPEYDGDTLAREFRRDALRFLKGERTRPPPIPANYFEPDALRRVEAAFARGAAGLDELAPALSPEALRPATAAWRGAARRLMRNWLRAVARRKSGASLEDLGRFRRYGG